MTITMVRTIAFASMAVFGLAGHAASQGIVIEQDCSWAARGEAPGKFTAIQNGQTTVAEWGAKDCTIDAAACAAVLNQCLAKTNFADNENWWLFTSDNGLQQGVAQPRHINHQTPQHGRWLSVYVNRAAHDYLGPWLQTGNIPEDITLPDGAIVAKLNYTAKDSHPSDPWITSMAKIDGYCSEQNRETHGGACNGGDWFYYLTRFGAFLSFDEIIGTTATGAPQSEGRAPSFGQPSAFCTDCHNPVERTDFLWTLDAALWKTEPEVIAAAKPDLATGQPTPADLCAPGTISLSADLPADVPLDPAQITDPAQAQTMFDCFSWQSFVALNWAASGEMRGQPDTTQGFGETAAPRVWETYKETFEVFQPSNPDWTVTAADWNNPVVVPDACKALIDEDGIKDAKLLQMVSKSRGGQVLNETHQAFGNQFNVLIDQNGHLVRYEVRINQDEFDFLAGNGYANTGAYSYAGPHGVKDLQFPTNANGSTGKGAIEIKAAWRQMCASESCTDTELTDAKRYYTVPALKYTPPSPGNAARCSVLPSVGLIGLHVIRKTQTAPQWVWSTFEHIDNVPGAGKAPTSGTYTLYDPMCSQPENMPTEAQCRSQRPGVLPPGKRQDFPSNRANCCANLQLLQNSQPGPAGSSPSEAIQTLLRNNVTRLDPIGPVAMNAAFAQAISTSTDGQSPFANYVLVNTQWPVNPRDESGAIHKLSCYQAGAVGRKAGCYKIVPRKGKDSLRLRNTSMETFQVSIDDGPKAMHFSSAGCINCHGDAGVDFSFVFTDAIEIDSPEGAN